jgi:hypothetical protein
MKEEPNNSIYFNFSIPVITTQGPAGIIPETITKVVLAPHVQIGLAPTAGPLDTINVSAVKPTVSIINPAVADATITGNLNMTWAPSNAAAGDTFSILFSSDGGLSWNNVAANLTGVTSLAVDTTTLPNTNDSIFRVIGTDGFNTFQADSVQIIISNPTTKPIIHITSPQPDQTTSQTGLFNLTGEGNDPTDGVLPDNNLKWTEGNVVLGSGPSIQAILTDGVHNITLTGVNSKDVTGTATITLTVVHNPIYLPLVNR